MFLFFRSQADVGNRAGTLKGITAATTAELINKVDTITDEGGIVKEGFPKLPSKYANDYG
jgi:hypothetical protein